MRDSEVLRVQYAPADSRPEFAQAGEDDSKIAALRKLKPNLDIEVDGGINAETAKLCIEAGANILVAGSYIFGTKERAQAIGRLRF